MLNLDVIRQATRLTRAGQLVEATALLQRMLRGESAPEAPSRPGGRIALAAREPLTIDAKANAVGETDSRQQSEPASAQPRKRALLLERTKGRPGIGLRGVIKRAPSTSDIVPDEEGHSGLIGRHNGLQIKQADHAIFVSLPDARKVHTVSEASTRSYRRGSVNPARLTAPKPISVYRYRGIRVGCRACRALSGDASISG